MTYTVDKTMTSAKVKSTVKADLTDLFIEFLKEKFGEESVGMLRVGNTSYKNVIGAVIGTATSNGEELPITATIDITVKEFENGKTSTGKPKVAFDFTEARADYETYLTEKATKSEEKAKAKAEKIAKDTARREQDNTVEDF